MVIPNQSALTDAIADAARLAFSSLFSSCPGFYYYCTLGTTGEALPPIVSAWSHEALSAAGAGRLDREHEIQTLKWSYAESPYWNHGDEYFDEVRRLFLERPPMDYNATEAIWDAEFNLRLNAMEAAMARLDREGLFGVGDAREKVVILVEVVPPDRTNTERAQRLNPPKALTEWMLEAAEE
jgi:hypothetical protein